LATCQRPNGRGFCKTLVIAPFIGARQISVPGVPRYHFQSRPQLRLKDLFQFGFVSWGAMAGILHRKSVRDNDRARLTSPRIWRQSICRLSLFTVTMTRSVPRALLSQVLSDLRVALLTLSPKPDFRLPAPQPPSSSSASRRGTSK
jgi:hypothetical protein